jgi:hypothetical protein
MNNKVTFAALDQLLADLGFSKTPVDGSYLAYQHSPSDALLVVRRQRPRGIVDEKTLIVVRKILVEKGLIERDALESRLGANSAA